MTERPKISIDDYKDMMEGQEFLPDDFERGEELSPRDVAETHRTEITRLAKEFIDELLQKTQEDLSFRRSLWNDEEDGRLQTLADMTGNNQLSERILTPEYVQMKIVFIEEVVRIVEGYRRQGNMGSVQHIEIGFVREYFSQSPNILEGMQMFDQFRLAGFLERQPGLEYLTERVTQEQSYDATFNWDIDSEQAESIVYDCSVEDQLDFLLGMKYGALAAAGESFAEAGVHNFLHLLAYFEQASPYPLVQIQASVLKRQILERQAFIEEVDLDPSAFELSDGEKDIAEKRAELTAESQKIQKEFLLPAEGQYSYSHIDEHHIGRAEFGILKQVGRKTGNKKQPVEWQWLDMALEDSAVLPFDEDKERVQDVILFTHLHHPDTRASIETILGISLSEVPLRSQIHLLRFAASSDAEEFGELHRIIHRPGIDRQALLNSFLACAERIELGQKILEFAATAPTDTVNTILGEYDKIRKETNDLEALVSHFFKKQQNQSVDTRLTVQSVIRRGNQALEQAMENASSAEHADNNPRLDIDIAIFTGLFRAAFKGKEGIDVRDVVGLDAERKSADTFSSREWEEMTRIVEANWGTRGTFGEKVLASFRDLAAHPPQGIDFYTLSKDNHIVAFVRYDAVVTLPDGRTARAAKSLNVSPAYRGSALSEALFAESLTSENAHVDVILGTVHPSLDAGTHYVEKNNFTIAGVLENYAESGENIFDIRREPATQQSYEFADRKKYSAQKITELFESCTADKKYPCTFHGAVIEQVAAADVPYATSLVRTMTAQGYVGVRYLTQASDPTQRLYVFERLPAAESVEAA